MVTDAQIARCAAIRMSPRSTSTWPARPSTLPCDRLVAALGFTANLGPLLEWGIEIRRSGRSWSTRPWRTSVPGIYAAGDIVDYDGKVKLIATGFGEVATAVNNAAAYLNPSVSAFPGHLSDYAPPGATGRHADRDALAVIIGVGIDVVPVDRFAEAPATARRPLAERLFTPAERVTGLGEPRTAESLAARFAAKEALAKSLGARRRDALDRRRGARSTTPAGRRSIVRGTVADRAASLGVTRWHLSLSHDGGIASATVIAESADVGTCTASTRSSRSAPPNRS